VVIYSTLSEGLRGMLGGSQRTVKKAAAFGYYRLLCAALFGIALASICR